jgi:O-antigen/teichoic acid export membrane protein
MTGANRRLLVNAAALLAVNGLQRGVGFVAITILARLLDQRGLGAYTFAQSTSSAFYGLTRLGADAGLQVSLANLKLPGQKVEAEVLIGESLTVFMFIAAVASTLMALFAGPIASQLFAAPELRTFVYASAVVLISQVEIQYCYAVLAGLNAFVAYARATTLTFPLALALAVLGALRAGTTGAVWGGATGSALATVVLGSLLYRELASRGLHVRFLWPRGQALAMLSVGFPFYAAGLLVIPAEFMCSALLSRSGGVAVLGDLRVTQSLMTIATMIPGALLGPMISHLAAREGSLTALWMQVKATWVLSLAISIALATLWPVAISVIFGSSFKAAQSVGVAAVATFAPMLLLSVLSGALLASRRSFMLVAIGACQMLTMVAFASFLIFGYGLAGFLVMQAVSAATGFAAAAVALSLQFRGTFLQAWMAPLAILTVVVNALLIADVLLVKTLATRFAAGICAMGVLIMITASCVLSSDERSKIRDIMSAATQRCVALARFSS